MCQDLVGSLPTSAYCSLQADRLVKVLNSGSYVQYKLSKQLNLIDLVARVGMLTVPCRVYRLCTPCVVPLRLLKTKYLHTCFHDSIFKGCHNQLSINIISHKHLSELCTCSFDLELRHHQRKSCKNLNHNIIFKCCDFQPPEYSAVNT